MRSWLQLTNAQLSPLALTALLERFAWQPSSILDASDAELDAVAGVQSRAIARIRDPLNAATDRQVRWFQRHGVTIVRLGQPSYPALLRDVPDTPPILFVRGEITGADRSAVGLVGSRRATPYGRAMAERFAREMAGCGVTVVSGGAIGIDTAAHRSALVSGGRTIAVLGCGLDVDYPRANRELFEQIMEQGALLSEYPLGAQPDAWRFPLRNRLISGLSLGVLVVEAPASSGALITARYAVEHGRTVMAVPGNIDRETSGGTNNLIKDGAVVVTETPDILRALGLVTTPARREHQAALPIAWPDDSADTDGGRPAGLQLSEVQRRLLDSLSLVPRHIDAVAGETELSAVQAGVEMTLLELAGLVRRLPGNAYIRA